jgi:multimeric flavodoxin WrbA
MRITVLQGSPNKDGSTAMLVDRFVKGAEENGHSCRVLHVCDMDVSPCTGCIACGYEGPCAIEDGNNGIRSDILSSDMLVFATPLYYFGMTSQLKAVIDRFCSYNSSISVRNLRSALISVAWNSDDWTFEALTAHYRTLVRYLNLRDEGMILGGGCGTPSMTASSQYPDEAYEFGRRLG